MSLPEPAGSLALPAPDLRLAASGTVRGGIAIIHSACFVTFAQGDPYERSLASGPTLLRGRGRLAPTHSAWSPSWDDDVGCWLPLTSFHPCLR